MIETSLVLAEIDSIDFGNNEIQLDLKISKIQYLVENILSKNITTEKEIAEILDRVYWISIEIGNSKSFESSGKEKTLILKSLEIARSFYNNDKMKLSKYLNLGLMATNETDKEHMHIKEEINKL